MVTLPFEFLVTHHETLLPWFYLLTTHYETRNLALLVLSAKLYVASFLNGRYHRAVPH